VEMLLDPGSLGDYGHEIEQVSSFKYLGLAHTGDKCLYQRQRLHFRLSGVCKHIMLIFLQSSDLIDI